MLQELINFFKKKQEVTAVDVPTVEPVVSSVEISAVEVKSSPKKTRNAKPSTRKPVISKPPKQSGK